MSRELAVVMAYPLPGEIAELSSKIPSVVDIREADILMNRQGEIDKQIRVAGVSAAIIAALGLLLLRDPAAANGTNLLEGLAAGIAYLGGMPIALGAAFNEVARRINPLFPVENLSTANIDAKVEHARRKLGGHEEITIPSVDDRSIVNKVAAAVLLQPAVEGDMNMVLALAELGLYQPEKTSKKREGNDLVVPTNLLTVVIAEAALALQVEQQQGSLSENAQLGVSQLQEWLAQQKNVFAQNAAQRAALGKLIIQQQRLFE